MNMARLALAVTLALTSNLARAEEWVVQSNEFYAQDMMVGSFGNEHHHGHHGYDDCCGKFSKCDPCCGNLGPRRDKSYIGSGWSCGSWYGRVGAEAFFISLPEYEYYRTGANLDSFIEQDDGNFVQPAVTFAIGKILPWDPIGRRNTLRSKGRMRLEARGMYSSFEHSDRVIGTANGLHETLINGASAFNPIAIPVAFNIASERDLTIAGGDVILAYDIPIDDRAYFTPYAGFSLFNINQDLQTNSLLTAGGEQSTTLLNESLDTLYIGGVVGIERTKRCFKRGYLTLDLSARTYGAISDYEGSSTTVNTGGLIQAAAEDDRGDFAVMPKLALRYSHEFWGRVVVSVGGEGYYLSKVGTISRALNTLNSMPGGGQIPNTTVTSTDAWGWTAGGQLSIGF